MVALAAELFPLEGHEALGVIDVVIVIPVRDKGELAGEERFQTLPVLIQNGVEDEGLSYLGGVVRQGAHGGGGVALP